LQRPPLAFGFGIVPPIINNNCDMNKMVEIAWVSPKLMNSNGVPMRFAMGNDGHQAWDEATECLITIEPSRFYTEDETLFDKVIVGNKFMKKES